MHQLDMEKPSREFSACWAAAGRHIERQAQGNLRSWLKASLTPPFLEHLSFRLGNQLFFIRLHGTNTPLKAPGNLAGLLAVAQGCNGHACLMPMRRVGEEWTPAAAGWGLLALEDDRPIDPPALITADPIIMTDWELQDFAVQIVRERLAQEGRRILSSQGNPAVDPALWFEGDTGPEWVVVRAARYPSSPPPLPTSIAEIARRCAPMGPKGHFAAVAVASDRDPFISGAAPTPLLRGHGLIVRYEGLIPAS